MGAGILPVALYRGTLFILLGQERHSNYKWCDFGGTPHKGEKPFKTAIREGTEELNGFFGTEEELEKDVNSNMLMSIYYDKYTSYVYRVKYDRNLPTYFNNNNKFIEKNAPDIVDTHHNGLYEKKTINWFSVNKFRNSKYMQMVRPHYVEHITSILKNTDYIIGEIDKLPYFTRSFQ